MVYVWCIIAMLVFAAVLGITWDHTNNVQRRRRKWKK